MEFWGIEVKPGQTVKCQPGEEKYIHLSQASLGESKKGNVSVPLYVNFEGKKFVIGTLSSEKFPQFSYDLVFEKEFELSHSWKDGSVFFTGYKTVAADEDSEGFSDTDSESDKGFNLVPLEEPANGKPALKKGETQPTAGKAKVAPSKVKGKIQEPAIHDGRDEDSDEDGDEDEDDDSDEDDVSEDGVSSDENMAEAEDESDEEESSEEEKVTPKKPEGGKKRSAGSDTKTPAQSKKAKVATPVGKADGKKGGHTATPYPKQAAKTPTDSKPKAQTPKSGGSFSCKSCSKAFNSDIALQSHTKAKHEN